MYKKIIYVVLDTYKSPSLFEIEKIAEIYGFDIEFWCVGNLYYQNYSYKADVKRGDLSVYIANWKELIKQLYKKTNCYTLFVFTVLGIGRRTYLIQMLLRILGGKFVCVEVGNGVGYFQRKNQLPDKSVLDFLKPEIIFLSHKGYLYTLPSRRAVDNWNIAYTGPYNLHRYQEEEKRGTKREINYKYALFCDENLVYHKEAEIQNQKWVEDGEEYFNQCNKLFRRIKEELGLETVVALHPNTAANTCKSRYDVENQILGKTISLLKYAEIVILYACTTLDIAVLYNKPILFYTSHDLEKCNQNLDKGAITASYKENLNMQYIYIDQLKKYENLEKYLYFDEKKYKEYKDRYILPEEGITSNYPDILFEYAKNH